MRLLALIFIIVGLGSPDLQTWAAQPQLNTGSTLAKPGATNGGLNVVIPSRTERARIRTTHVFFITNREINFAAMQNARSTTGTEILEDVFSETLGIPIFYGFAEIGYPTNRMPGDDNYGPSPREETPVNELSPFRHFFVNDYDFLSPEAFWKLIAQYPDESLFFVHGLNHTFREAAERFAQLTVDVQYTGVPVFFSWPSAAYRGRYFPLVYTKHTYLQTLDIAKSSFKYVALAIEQVANQLKSINVIAHSMGSYITVNAAVLRDVDGENEIKSVSQSPKPLSLLLAGADVGTKEFNIKLRPKIVTLAQSVVIYCANDWLLVISQGYNDSDERLGYCGERKEKQPMMGVRIFSIRGNIGGPRDSHSYYLNAPKVLKHIRRFLDASVADSDEREIKLP